MTERSFDPHAVADTMTIIADDTPLMTDPNPRLIRLPPEFVWERSPTERRLLRAFVKVNGPTGPSPALL